MKDKIAEAENQRDAVSFLHLTIQLFIFSYRLQTHACQTPQKQAF